MEIKLINLTKGEKKIMENKPSMSRVERLHREKVTRYSIRKYSFGAASVAVAALFMFLGNGAVSVQADQIQPVQPGDTAAAPATPTLDKTQLESYISEIETKLSNGSYDNKTEESVAVLKAELESAKATLANATTQAELKKAYSKLVTTANSKLRNKPVEKKETPAVDTTEGKETVGKKADNTEPKSESNSIENTGSHDPRNDKEIDKDNAFRTEATAATHNPTTVTSGNLSYTLEFSDDAKKEIYAYNEEDTDISIAVNSTVGKITSASVKGGSGQYMDKSKKKSDPLGAEEIDGFGWTYTSIVNETQGPATLKITGKPNDAFKKLNAYTKDENQNAVLGDRYIQLSNDAGDQISDGKKLTDYGYFKMVVKSQTYKYQPKELTNTDKVLVSNPNQLTTADLESIKNALKVEYSTKNTDARLTSLKGTEVADPKTVVDTVTDSGSNLVVTYKDGSTDTIPKGTLIKSGNAPTVNMPRPASGGPLKTSILSTDNTITGTGTPGSKITIQVASAENGKVLKEITDIPVDASGNWTVTLENGLNSNVPVGGNAKAQNFFAPKNPVKVFETKDGIESASTDTYVSIGASKVLPSEASKDKASVVAGSKEVVLEVPHDAGISYFWYHDKETGKEVQIDIQRDKEVAENLGIKVADKDVDKVAIKSVTKGEFYNTITLEMKKNIKEGVVRIISHNNDGTHSSKAGKVSTPVTNEKPVVASVSGEDTTTVITNSQLNLLSLVKVTDHEDDQDATLGTKGTPRVVSVDGDTNVTEINTSEVGEHTVVYKTVDSQGKESDEYTHKVIVRENKVPEVSIPYSVDGKKDIYVYANEDIDIDLKFTDDSGKIKSATILQGGNNALNPVDKANPNVINNEYDTTFTQIDGETATTATEATPAIVKITGKMTKDTPGLVASKFPTDANGEYRVVTRYATSTDMDGGKIVNRAQGNSYATDPGAFALVIKAQTAKYDIKDPETKVPVVDANNVTDAEFNEIKKNIKIQYSTENPDKNLADKKGTDVENQDDHIESIEKVGNEVVVTYKDGSIDKKPLTDFARTNPAPTVELPYSNADKRQIYVYTGENTDLTFKASDDAALKKVYLRGPGNKDFDNTAGYGFTTGKINDGALESGEGTVASDKQNATIKMTGVTNLKAGQKWTSIIVAQDEDDARSINNFNSTEDFAERQQRPGYVEFVVKDQTSKYDIKAPTEKVAVTDPANVTEAELAKIKEKLQLEHNKNNDDANISKDAPVTDKDAKIDSVTKDDQGNLVVTYKDGSKDTRPLSEFVTLDKQPAIDEVNKAAEKQIAAINSTPNATDEEKAAAIAKVNADKQKALDEIAKPEVTTKDALDKAQTAGTGAIAKDNPVVSAKPEAKKAIDEAVKAKEAALDARTDLTDDEKKAAKDAAKAAADKAKAAVDAATTDAEVTKAKEAGTKAVADVTPVAKAEAKKAIAKALEDKNSEIDKRTDLTDEEKTAAKNEAKDKADAQLAKIKEQPDAAATPAAAKTAQDVVDAAKETGVDEVTAVNPVAKAKPEAKKAIDKALEAKNQEIDARTDLTPEEKTKAKEVAKAQADVAKDAVDAATTNAAVDKAKADGTTAVANVTPVVKEAAKKAIADELAEKEKAIDARKDLTDAEKAKAKEEAQAKAKEATDAINKQPDVATTPTAAKTAQDAVDAAKAKGVADVKAVNPVAKEAAKQAIADELAKKVGEIDARPDLTDKEKDAAKKDAQAKAKKATDAINAQPDNAETPEKAAEAQTAVDGAKDKGVADVKAVNPVAKEKAKEEIAKELAKKEEAIDARPDLTDEEKAAAKKDAQAKAKEATDAIDAQPSIAETPEKAAEAQKAVDGAKDKGIADVKAVDPVAAKKPEAKKAVDAALKAKVDAINAREDLTPAEKDEAKKAAEKAADDAKKAIDAATTDAAVDAAKNAGTGEVAKVNPVAKEKAKEEIAKELAKKEEAIDGRKDLTDEEKAAAKKEAQDKAKEATDAINDQPANAETPEKAAEAQKAVDGAKDKGVADVKAVNPEAVTKPAAKKAIEDKLAKQLEDIANTPDATDEEKKVAADAAKALAEEAKEEIDKAGTDAKVKQLQEKAEGEIEKSVPVVEDKPNARKAIDEEATAKKVEIDARNDLTPEAKAKLKAKVDKVAEKSKAAIDAVSSVDDVNTIEEADKAAIKAIGEVNRPIDKVLVKDPSALTDEEKAKILEEVKKVNPTAKEVKYDENGNIEVTTKAGDKGIINPTKLVKTEDQLDNGKGGNDINKPLDKVIVKDPSNLTDEEKAKIVAKVEEVNPDAIVTIDEDGTVSVSTPEGKTAAIPASELVRTKEDTSNPDAGNSKIVKPADKVAGEANDPDDQAKVEEKLRELNPETKSVKFDEDGNATVTLKDGTTATIPSEDLFKSEVDATKPNAGNDIVKPADKTVVANPEKLTDAEKKAIEDKVKAVNPDATVVVDDKGNATVTTPEGKTAVIPAADLTKDPAAATKPNAGNAVNTPASKVEVKDPANLTDEEKAKVKKAIEAVNPGSKVVVDDKGNATVTTPEGNTAVIPAADVTKSAADAGKANAGNAVNTPASKVEVKDPANLIPEEKKAIEDKVKAVNPDATVVVDDKGNATVTTPEGKTATIPATDLTKSASDAGKANAGNGANTPATKTVVKDPTNLTDEEKAKVKKAVEDVNPGSTVVVNDKGDVIVTKGDGTVLVIPELDLVIPEDKLTDPTQQNGVNTPATRVLVGDKAKLTADEIEKVKESIKAVNPGSTVVVDENGNATVTTPEGKTATIPAAQLVKDAKDVAAKNNGENINLDFEKETVADFNNLTDAEKEAAKAKIKGANADVLEVIFDKAGNATVITKDGKVYTIVAKDIFKQRPYVPSNGGGNNGATNTDAKVDKAKLEGAIRQLDELIIKESAKFDAETAKEANALSADAKKVFANADATQAEVDAMVKRIEDFMAKVASSTDHATPANDQATQTPAVAPATAQAAANARKVAKELPNTGTADSTVAMVAAAASALLGLGLAGRRRKEDEEA